MKTMTDRDRYKQAFSVLHVSRDLSFESKPKRSRYAAMRRVTAACACAVLVLGCSIIAYAYGEQIIQEIFGWGGNMKVTETVDSETGRTDKEVTYNDLNTF